MQTLSSKIQVQLKKNPAEEFAIRPNNENKTKLKNVDQAFESAGPNTGGQFFSPAQRFLRFRKRTQEERKPKRKRNLTAVMLTARSAKAARDTRRRQLRGRQIFKSTFLRTDQHEVL